MHDVPFHDFFFQFSILQFFLHSDIGIACLMFIYGEIEFSIKLIGVESSKISIFTISQSL